MGATAAPVHMGADVLAPVPASGSAIAHTPVGVPAPSASVVSAVAPPTDLPGGVLEVARTHIAQRDFDLPCTLPPGAGYIRITRGSCVHVLYDGQDGEEVGWSFGFVADAIERGWFPSS